MREVTQLMHALGQGDRHAASRLPPLVYDELRKLAAQRMAREQPGQALQPTALVHEAYQRLVDHNPQRPQNSRGHCLAVAIGVLGEHCYVCIVTVSPTKESDQPDS